MSGAQKQLAAQDLADGAQAESAHQVKPAFSTFWRLARVWAGWFEAGVDVEPATAQFAVKSAKSFA
jgi:hypothetical protein